eukprot:gene686-688_t
MGYAGIYSLAHTIFFGIGAYTAAYLALNVTDSLLISMLVAFSLSALVSMALALPALRVRGEYFVAASLGLQVIGVTIFAEWKSVTGGLGGMIGIPRPRLFSYVFIDDTAFLILSVIVLLAVLGILSLLVRGSFGRSLMAIRDSESAAQAYGKHVNAVKTLSVAISSGLAAIAGVLYTFYMSFINVEGFTLETSILLMAMVIIGGTGTLLGPVAELGAIQQIVYGAAMVQGEIRVSTAEILLQIKGLNKNFGGLQAISDVTLDLPAGVITTLVGPNGAGKTTLFNLITGHLIPTTGTVHWLGAQINGIEPWKIARMGIARTFQDLRLFNQMTVEENIMTVMERGSWIWQSGQEKNAERIERVLNETGLIDKRKERAVDLAYAERKFLSLARIMASEAKLWLLDEPASGLDPRSFEKFVTLLRQYAASGVTICIIEHNLDIVIQLSDRVAFLDQGKLLAQGSSQDILKDPHLAAIYFGDHAGDEPFLEAKNLRVGYGGRPVLNDFSVRLEHNEVLCLIGHNGAGKSTLLKALFGLIPVEQGTLALEGRLVAKPTPKSMNSAGIALVPEGRGVFPGLTVAEIMRLGFWANGTPKGEQAARLDWKERKMSILIVEQNVKEALKISDRVMVMKSGELIKEGTPDEFADNTQLMELY